MVAGDPVSEMRIRVRTYESLYNEFDSSPLLRRDLNGDVENFLVEWAREAPRGTEFALTVEVVDPAGMPGSDPSAGEAIRAFFQRSASSSQAELRRLIQRGRISLFVGLAFLALMLAANEAFGAAVDRPHIEEIAETSLIVAGWVALWRPMEIFLYDWWPLLGDRRLYDRLGRMRITFEAAN